LLFGSGKDDCSSNGNSGADCSKTLLFGSGKSYNEICLCYCGTNNKQITCYSICNTVLTIGPLTHIFTSLFPKIQFNISSSSMPWFPTWSVCFRFSN
jgi:hypothetical protein